MAYEKFYSRVMRRLGGDKWDELIRTIATDLAALKERATLEKQIADRLEARGLQVIEDLVTPVSLQAQDRVDEIDALINGGTDAINGFVTSGQDQVDNFVAGANTQITNLVNTAEAATDAVSTAAAEIADYLAELQSEGLPAALVRESGSRVFVTPAQKVAIDAAAPAASPAFTGTPTAPTATAGTSTTQIATTAFVAAALAAMVNSAPSALDTLNELAAALGNDASFSTSVTTALGKRVRFDAAQTLTEPEQAQARANIGVGEAFPAGTKMLFQQTSAPTGWTKETTHNDKALRVVSGAASSGGTNAFSTVFAQTAVGARTLSEAQMPSHLHDFIEGGFPGGGRGFAGGINFAYADINRNTDSRGSSESHDHTITMAIQYVDIIIAAKN